MGKLTSVLKLKKKWKKNVYLHIGALPCGKQGKKTLLLVPLRQKQTHLFEPGCRTYCRSRPSWGSEGKTHQGSVDGAQMLSFFWKLVWSPGLQHKRTLARRERQGNKNWLCNEKIQVYFSGISGASQTAAVMFSQVSMQVMWCCNAHRHLQLVKPVGLIIFFFFNRPRCFLTAFRQARRSRQFSLPRCASSLAAAPHLMLTVNHHHSRCPCGLNKSCAISQPS